jgi:hypothetical protein
MADAFERMEWAEQEIAAAQARHPQQAGRIWHSFSLFQPNPGLGRMTSEMVYRSHCREILDRVAAGEDTRPGTAAEGCCALRNTSLQSGAVRSVRRGHEDDSREGSSLAPLTAGKPPRTAVSVPVSVRPRSSRFDAGSAAL